MTQFFEGPTPSSSPATPPLIRGGGSNYARDERTLLMQSAPDIELDVFDRNPLNFIILWHFPMKLQKKELIQEEDWPDCSNTQVGMQKRLSNHQGPPTVGYQHVKKILLEKYRNPYHVMAEYGEQIKAWPIMQSGNSEGYQRSYNFLWKFERITQSAQCNQLGSPDVICMLLAKLPGLEANGPGVC